MYTEPRISPSQNMEKRENLELVNVAFENNGQKAVLTFLDKERAEVRTVNFNRQVYRDNKYVADDAKAEKVDTWCHDIFGCEFTELPSCVGKKYTVYEYDDFNSLFEVQIIIFHQDPLHHRRQDL